VAKLAQRAALEPAYRRTVYRAFAPGGAVDLRVGQRCRALDRLLAASGCSDWAFLTAWNPQSKPLPVWRNAMRSRHLARALRALGYRFLPGLGIPREPGWRPEVSLLVLGLPAARALRIARAFGQNAIVAGRRGGRAQLFWCRK
jgi:hypothetical protein